jgi:hypothetical protein
LASSPTPKKSISRQSRDLKVIIKPHGYKKSDVKKAIIFARGELMKQVEKSGKNALLLEGSVSGLLLAPRFIDPYFFQMDGYRSKARGKIQNPSRLHGKACSCGFLQRHQRQTSAALPSSYRTRACIDLHSVCTSSHQPIASTIVTASSQKS